MKRYAIRDRLTGMWMGREGWHPEKYVLYTSQKTAMGTIKHLLSPQNITFQLPELPQSDSLSSLNQFLPFSDAAQSIHNTWSGHRYDFREYYPVAPCINLSLLGRLEVVEFEVLPTGNSFFVEKRGVKLQQAETPSPCVPMKAHNHWRGPDYSLVTTIPGLGTFWLSLRDYGVGYRESNVARARRAPMRRSTERYLTERTDLVYTQLNLTTLQGKAVHLRRDKTNWTHEEKELDYQKKEVTSLEKDPFSDE